MGIGGAEPVGVGRTILLRDQITSSAHAGWARLGIVRVGGEEVHPAVGEHAVGHPLGLLSHLADHGAGGDLGEQANAHPVCEALGVALQRRIAFGVGEDGAHTGQAELVEGLVQVRGKAVVGQLDQQVVATVEGVFLGVGDGVLHVVVAEVEVAA